MPPEYSRLDLPCKRSEQMYSNPSNAMGCLPVGSGTLAPKGVLADGGADVPVLSGESDDGGRRIPLNR